MVRMSVVRDLERIHEILERVKEHPDCPKITHYDNQAIEVFLQGLDRAIQRYKNEAKRVRKYYP
jgi:hypothetical protein